MITRSLIASMILVALASVAACDKENDTTPVVRDSSPNTTQPHTTQPDNTVKNKGDVEAGAKTPVDQSQTAADVKNTADIRRAIMDDKTMSVNAQNSKIITDKSGLVTLRGVVNSQAEKDSIEVKAKMAAGTTRVDNQLEVKTN